VKTFKQFLESDELDDLTEVMTIRKLIPSLTTAEAKIVHKWYWHDEPSYDDLPDEVSEKIANSKFAETDYAGQNMIGDPDHVAAPIIGQKLRRVVREYIKTGILFHEEVDPLQDLQMEMFFRKELDLSPSMAKWAMKWAKSEIDCGDLPTDVWDYIVDWAAAQRSDDIWAGPSWKLQDRARTEVALSMQKKYGMSL
jgi:hypothetical protein